MSAKIMIMPNGPVRISGEFELIGTDGKAIQLPGTSAAICRCGHSNKKPFCDGSHRTNCFVDPVPTPAAAQ